MELDPKISLEKSWKFTPQVLILIILGIIVILGISIVVWQLTKTLPSQPEPFPQPEEKTREDLLKELSIPEEKWGTGEEPSPETLESLTPSSNKEVSGPPEEILKELSP